MRSSLLVAQTRVNFLSYELDPVPWLIASMDGSLRPTHDP